MKISSLAFEFIACKSLFKEHKSLVHHTPRRPNSMRLHKITISQFCTITIGYAAAIFSYYVILMRILRSALITLPVFAPRNFKVNMQAHIKWQYDRKDINDAVCISDCKEK